MESPLSDDRDRGNSLDRIASVVGRFRRSGLEYCDLGPRGGVGDHGLFFLPDTLGAALGKAGFSEVPGLGVDETRLPGSRWESAFRGRTWTPFAHWKRHRMLGRCREIVEVGVVRARYFKHVDRQNGKRVSDAFCEQ